LNDKQIAFRDKCMAFAVRVVKLRSYLCEQKHEHDISRQLLRSGTAIGALQREAYHAESDADLVHKLAIAQKECNESLYWIELLYLTNYITKAESESLSNDALELLKMLTASIQTLKKRIKQKQ
jgi:four helix bundle protein